MLSRGRTVGDVALSVGVREGDLYRWRDKYGGSVRVTAATTETAEQDVKRLRMERNSETVLMAGVVIVLVLAMLLIVRRGNQRSRPHCGRPNNEYAMKCGLC
jgi:transposase-like protein